MPNLLITSIILALVSFNALEQGFRLKRDMNANDGWKTSLYDTLFHGFVVLHVALWGLIVWYSDKYGLKFSYPSLIHVGVYFTLLRFGIYSLIINLVNCDNRAWNYVRQTHWSFKIWSKIFQKQMPVSTLWGFRGMAASVALLYLLFY